jgi:hypothetical protein
LRRSRGEAALQALTVVVPNYAGVGLPIASTVLGPTATVSVAVALAAGSILVSPFTLMLIELSVGKGQNDADTSAARVRRARRHALTTPVVLAPALGILLSLSELNLGTVAGASLDLIGRTAGGVALFLTGLILSAQSLRLDRQVVAASGTANMVRLLLVARDRSCASDPLRDCQDSHSTCGCAVGFLRHLVRGELSVGLGPSRLHGDLEHRVQYCDARDHHRGALSLMRCCR